MIWRLWIIMVRLLTPYDPVINLDEAPFGRCEACGVPLNKRRECWWC